MKRSVALGVVLGGTVTLLPLAIYAQSQLPAHVMFTPAEVAELKWTDSAAFPGAKVTVIEGPLNEAVPFTFRTKFPSDFKIPAHWHPVLKHVTVISGTISLGWATSWIRTRPRHLRRAASSSIRQRPLISPGSSTRLLFRCTASDRGDSLSLTPTMTRG